MSEIDSGGYAFPGAYRGEHGMSRQPGIPICPDGMTLRQWYAGMALQVMTREMDLDAFECLHPEELAKGAFVIADAMLRAGKGENK